jgi:hypothetical protein
MKPLLISLAFNIQMSLAFEDETDGWGIREILVGWWA